MPKEYRTIVKRRVMLDKQYSKPVFRFLYVVRFRYTVESIPPITCIRILFPQINRRDRRLLPPFRHPCGTWKVELRGKISRYVVCIKLESYGFKLSKVKSGNVNLLRYIWEIKRFLSSCGKHDDFNITFSGAHVWLIFE